MGVNSPIPVRLEDESRKAANILRSFVDSKNNGLDKVIPRQVLEHAAGFAIFSVFKMGFVFSARAGSGIVIARLPDGSWSPPSAIGLGGFGFGGQMGAEVTDFLIVLNSRAAVTSFMSAGSLTLGGNLSVAVGPLGRNAEGSGSVNTKGQLAAMYSYSKTKGLFGGVSVEGSVIIERQDANRLAYGGSPSAKQILSGSFDPPDWAYPLIDQLNKSTGLPGGQRWRNEDEEGEGEGGGMGYGDGHGQGRGSHQRGHSHGNYVFGEGVGAGGNTPPLGNRKRSGSLFGSSAGGAVDRTGSPGRPSSSRRSSTLNPFSKSGTASPGQGKSSESYNAGLMWDSNGPMGLGIGATSTGGSGSRSRSGSLSQRVTDVPQPFSFMTDKREKDKDKDLLGDWGEKPDLHSEKHAAAPQVNHGAGERDLLGTWSSDGNGLSASFARMSTGNIGGVHGVNGTGVVGRSRSNSRPTPFADILENPSSPNYDHVDQARERERDYTPHETVSSFARKDFSAISNSNANGSGSISVNGYAFGNGPPPRRSPAKLSKVGDRNSSFGSLGKEKEREREFSPFDDAPVGRLRSGSGSKGRQPFEDYMDRDWTSASGLGPNSGASRNTASASDLSPKKELKLKTGLENNSTQDGYARAVALFEFKQTDPNDLGMKAGEVVVVLDRAGDGGEWWRGMSGDGRRTGIFPVSYVEVVYIPKVLKGGVGRGELRRRAGGDEFE